MRRELAVGKNTEQECMLTWNLSIHCLHNSDAEHNRQRHGFTRRGCLPPQLMMKIPRSKQRHL